MEYKIVYDISNGMSKDIKRKIVTADNVFLMYRGMEYSDLLVETINQYKGTHSLACGDRIVQIENAFTDNGKYHLFTEWVEGDTLEAILPRASKEESYTYGVRSAKLLMHIHDKCKVIADDCVDELFFENEIRKYIEQNGKDQLCELVYKYKEIILNGENQVFLHSDYHVGNLMLNEQNKLILIDLEKCETGSYYRDLGLNETYNLAISAEYSKGFLQEFSKLAGFSWEIYGINMAFFFIVYCNWKRKLCKKIDVEIKKYKERHNINNYGEPLWL